MSTGEYLPSEREYAQTKKRGFKVEREDGNLHLIVLLSFREPRHTDRVVDELTEDRPIAFQGWGVSGVAKRVDYDANSRAFWFYKEGRPLGSKVPLLEPPEYIVEHVDWASVHPNFRYLRNPNELKKLWKVILPFHMILPYQEHSHTLSNEVITPAFDPNIAPETPVPTMCAFWIEDPALVHLLRKVKKEDSGYQIGVSSLNSSHEAPPFNTKELIQYLQDRKISHYNIVVEDPLVEPFDIASSHSQFAIPLDGQKPVWLMKRKGSLSAVGFSTLTGFRVDEQANLKVAVRRESEDIDLDYKLRSMAKRIGSYYQWSPIQDLKTVLHLA